MVIFTTQPLPYHVSPFVVTMSICTAMVIFVVLIVSNGSMRRNLAVSAAVIGLLAFIFTGESQNVRVNAEYVTVLESRVGDHSVSKEAVYRVNGEVVGVRLNSGEEAVQTYLYRHVF